MNGPAAVLSDVRSNYQGTARNRVSIGMLLARNSLVQVEMAVDVQAADLGSMGVFSTISQ